VLGPFLRRAAATGLAIAITTGLWLFSVNAAEYLANNAFRWKLALLVLAIFNITYQNLKRNDRGLQSAAPSTRVAAGISFCLWIAVLIAGRWIGFV
jgi:hypothetical protein